MYEACLVLLVLNLPPLWTIIPKSGVHHSKFDFQVRNAAAKQHVDGNNNALTRKTSEVDGKKEVREISVSEVLQTLHNPEAFMVL